MVDLAKTQVQWSNLFEKMGTWIAAFNVLDENFKLFSRARTQVLEEFDENDIVQDWSFTGAIKNSNTDVDGKLYVTIDADAPSATETTVSVFKDAAKSNKVAEGTLADSLVPGTLTLAEQNSSGLSGTVKVNSVPSVDDTDIVLTLTIDFPRRNIDLFNVDQFELETQAAFAAELFTEAITLADARDTLRGIFESNFLLTELARFIQSTEETLVDSITTNTDGVITLRISGLLNDLSDTMQDNTPTQTILQNVVTLGSVVFDGDNTGLGAVTGRTADEGARTGIFKVVCTDETIGTEKFTITLQDTETGEILDADDVLQIKKAWLSTLPIGISMTLNRTITENGDTSAQLSNFTVSSESSTNTDSGTLFWNLVDVAGTRTFTLFNSSAKLASDKVAEGSKVGDGTITLTEQNGSGLSGSVDVTFTTDDIDSGNTFVLNVFKIDDKFQFTVSNDEAGIFQTFFNKQYEITIINAASGSETIKEGLAK